MLMVVSATTLAIIAASAAGLQAVGSIASGFQQKGQAEALAKIQLAESEAASQQRLASANIQRQQAQREKDVAAQSESDFRRRQRAAAASVRAASGARGIDVSTGSPLLTAEDFATETEVQARRIREGGEIRSTRLEQQADLLDFTGRAIREIGRGEASASRIAGSAALGAGLLGGGVAVGTGTLRTARVLRDFG